MKNETSNRTSVQQRIKYLDGASIVLLLSGMLAVGSYELISFPLSMAAFLVPFSLSAVACVMNRRLKPTERVRAFRFGFISCWHPYCTGLMAIAALLLALPNTNRVLETLHVAGIVLVCSVGVWSFVYSLVLRTR